MQRYASEELRDWFTYVAARITPAGYVRQRAAESRAARAEALDTKGANDDERNDAQRLAGTDARSTSTGPPAARSTAKRWTRTRYAP